MSKLVPDVEPAKPKKTNFAACPRCSQPVDGFQIDEQSIDDVLITLKPCGCMSHSADDHYREFVELVNGPGGLS